VRESAENDLSLSNHPASAQRSPRGGSPAEVPDLPGCMSDGETPQEAVDNVMDAITCWIEAAEENGRPVPALASADAA